MRHVSETAHDTDVSGAMPMVPEAHQVGQPHLLGRGGSWCTLHAAVHRGAPPLFGPSQTPGCLRVPASHGSELPEQCTSNFCQLLSSTGCCKPSSRQPACWWLLIALAKCMPSRHCIPVMWVRVASPPYGGGYITSRRQLIKVPG